MVHVDWKDFLVLLINKEITTLIYRREKTSQVLGSKRFISNPEKQLDGELTPKKPDQNQKNRDD